jgi:dihydropteroate synthase
VAEAALAAGARMVNDVSGGRADGEMLPLVARSDVAYVCMHWRGHATHMQDLARYTDVVAEVIRELSGQLATARAAGVADDQLIVDPGFGFAKTGEHNWELLQRLEELEVWGLPLLIAVSRKTFLGTLLRDGEGRLRPPRLRDDATLALTTEVARRGVWGVRVHSVRASRDAIAVVQRLGRRD